jgi:hypothetical protein
LALHVEGDLDRATALHEESLSIRRAHDFRPSVAISLINLAAIALDRGDRVGAAALARECLGLARDMDLGLEIAGGLEVIAAADGATDHVRSARMLGAAEALREAIDARIWPHEQAQHARIVRRAQGRLDRETFTALRAEGRGLTIDEAVALALDAARAVRDAGAPMEDAAGK